MATKSGAGLWTQGQPTLESLGSQSLRGRHNTRAAGKSFGNQVLRLSGPSLQASGFSLPHHASITVLSVYLTTASQV